MYIYIYTHTYIYIVSAPGEAALGSELKHARQLERDELPHVVQQPRVRVNPLTQLIKVNPNLNPNP